MHCVSDFSFGARNAIATKTNLLGSINKKMDGTNKTTNKKNNNYNNNKKTTILACNDKEKACISSRLDCDSANTK